GRRLPGRQRPPDRRCGRRALHAHVRRGAGGPGGRAARWRRVPGDGRRRRHRPGAETRRVTVTIHHDHPLSRFATVRTGGTAEHFARAGSAADLAELVAWAAAEGHEVSVVGSGSNLLIADAGVRGLVVKLDRELAAIDPDGDAGLVCGGGARLPA